MHKITPAQIMLMIVASSCFIGSHSASGQGKDQTAGKSVPVVATDVVTKSVPIQIATIGRVQTIASVAVRSRIDGVITTVHVMDGQEVKSGDPLFTLDDRALQGTLRQAEANLARDRAQLENARREVERMTPLMQREFASRQQFDQMRTNAATLEATTRAAQAQIEVARTQLSYTVIRAPIAGRLGTINFKAGNSIRANDTTPLATLNQIRPIYVGFSIPQANFATIQRAMASGPVKVMAEIPEDKESAQMGKLTYIENAIDAATNTLGVKATFENPQNRLWPGQFVNVSIILGVEPNALVVPADALQAGQRGSFVFVVREDSTVEARTVTVDRRIGDDLVISKGLKLGEKVVTAGQLRLDDGTRVTLRTANDNTR